MHGWTALVHRALAVLAVLLAPAAASGQQPLEGEAWRQLTDVLLRADTLPGIWQAGRNPAGLGAAGLPECGRAFVQVGHAGGEFRRPQRPGSVAAAAAGMDGTRRGAGWTAVGSFTYERRQDADVAWSIVADPYAGFPYVWADQRGGTWQRDGAQLHTALASPLWRNRIALGAAVDYDISQGARRNDPRPLFRRRDLKVALGAASALGGGRTVGMHGYGAWGREDNEIGYFAGDDPVVYQLRGYGLFARTTLVRSVRAVEGRELGAGAQIAQAGGARSWSLGARVYAAADSARVNIAHPEFGGGYRRSGAEMRATLRQTASGWSREVEVEAALARGEGTDPFVEPRAVNALDTRAHVLLGAAAWRGADRRAARWLVSGAGGVTLDEREDVFVATDWQVATAAVRAGVATRRNTAGRVVLLAGVDAGVRHPLQRRFDAGRPTDMTPILVRPDFDYHSATAADGAIALGAEFGSAAGSSVRVLLRAGAAHAPSHDAGTSRFAATLRLEIGQ